MNLDKITKLFEDSIGTKKDCISNGFKSIATMAEIISDSIENGNKLMLCGNGGSAADAQHLAAEMLIRLRPSNNREGIPAIALAQDTSTLTACGNDFGFDKLYERMIKTLGKPGDCLIGLTTSGNSENIIKAFLSARKIGVKTFGFLGSGGGEILKYCDESFIVPSYLTGRIQEAHITAGHALMECVEDTLISKGYIAIKNIM